MHGGILGNQRAYRRKTQCSATAAAMLISARRRGEGADDPPYRCTRGFFYVAASDHGQRHTYMAGQMYVDVHIPAADAPHPIIMVTRHRSATTYFGTPDGREGWAQYSCARLYAVYVVDQPGRGRSGYSRGGLWALEGADGDGGQRRYLSQAKYKLWPQAHLHTQWPGSGAPMIR